VALKRFRFIFNLIILTAVAVTLPVARVQAEGGAPPAPAPALPSFGSFARQVMNGQADELRGVYAPGLFADQVVQQPAGDPAYISSQQDVLTEFDSALQLGSTGLLAHNYRAGRQFSQLQNGQAIHLIYGDGRTAAYIVTAQMRYRALQPNSAYSAFVDLASGTQIGASAVFSDVYGRPGALVLQTCIEANGISAWGRLFVIAEPYVDGGSAASTGALQPW